MIYDDGTILQFKSCKEIKRHIVKFTGTGYLFMVPPDEEIHDSSENNDPFFEDGWRISDTK